MDDLDVSHAWVSTFDDETSRKIVELVDGATEDGGTLGHVEPMSAGLARAFIDELERRTASGEAHVLLGHVDRSPAFLAVLTLSGMPTCRHRAELSKGIVHRRCRGRGLVRRGLHALVQRAEVLGVEQFVLDVREGSRAHALWERFGFQSFGVLEDYARVRGARHRGHFMVQPVAALRARLASRASAFETTQREP